MPRRQVSRQQRSKVSTRAHFCCEYCRSQEKYAPDPFSVEHIIPIVKGGTNELANLAYSCQGCNRHKYINIDAIDPATGDVVMLYNPRQHVWSEHFVWNEIYTQIIGLTAVGRATVDKLSLNRSGLVELRRVLVRVDAHPPKA